jgi:hypothetical protein
MVNVVDAITEMGALSTELMLYRPMGRYRRISFAQLRAISLWRRQHGDQLGFLIVRMGFIGSRVGEDDRVEATGLQFVSRI